MTSELVEYSNELLYSVEGKVNVKSSNSKI